MRRGAGDGPESGRDGCAGRTARAEEEEKKQPRPTVAPVPAVPPPPARLVVIVQEKEEVEVPEPKLLVGWLLSFPFFRHSTFLSLSPR